MITEPVCHYCGTPASADPATVDRAREAGVPPATIAREDGTFNPRTNRYACDGCYIAQGAPSRPWPGWKVPDDEPPPGPVHMHVPVVDQLLGLTALDHLAAD